MGQTSSPPFSPWANIIRKATRCWCRWRFRFIMPFVMASMSAECLMNYNSTAMSGRAGRNWYVDVRTRLQLIHNLMYHTHTQETAMTISSSWSSNVVEFHWQGKAFFPKRCHLGIRSLFLWLFGTGGSVLLWYLLCTWFCGSHRKTGKKNLHLPSYFPSYWWHKDTSFPMFPWHPPVL